MINKIPPSLDFVRYLQPFNPETPGVFSCQTKTLTVSPGTVIAGHTPPRLDFLQKQIRLFIAKDIFPGSLPYIPGRKIIEIRAIEQIPVPGDMDMTAGRKTSLRIPAVKMGQKTDRKRSRHRFHLLLHPLPLPLYLFCLLIRPLPTVNIQGFLTEYFPHPAFIPVDLSPGQTDLLL